MPNLKDSLNHVAIIGRYGWKPEASEGQRRLSLPSRTPYEEAAEKIGFELAFGPATTIINRKPYNVYAIVPPSKVESVWSPVDRAKVKSIPLTKQTPLIEALAKGSSPAEVGGVVFRGLLDHLDALRKFWHPDFSVQLSWAFGHRWMKDSTGKNPRLDDRQIREILFHPPVNLRLLAALRDESERLDANLEAFQRALVAALESRDILTEHAQRMAASAAESLRKLRADFETSELELPKDLERFVNGGEAEERILKDLALQFRTFRGHYSAVREVADCEPLFALIIVWYFSKVAVKDGNIAKHLYEQICKAHKDAAVMGEEQTLEDQKLSEGVLDQNLKDTLSSLQMDADTLKLVTSFSKSIMDFVKGVMLTVRMPSPQFSRKDLLEWLKAQFASLLPYGMDAGQEILAELEALTRAALTLYERMGALYDDRLTRELLLDAVKAEPESKWKTLWKECCKALPGGLSGKALGDKFRKHYNTRMSEILSVRFKVWLNQSLGEGVGLAQKLKDLTDQYVREIDLLGKKEGELAGMAGTGSIAAKSSEPDETEKKAEAVPMVAKAGAGGAAPKVEPTAAPMPAPAPAGGDAAGAAEELEDPLNRAFARLVEQGFGQGGEDDVAMESTVIKAVEALASVRRKIVKNLQDPKDPLTANARAKWRALALGEAIMAGDPAKSSLGDNHTSPGIRLLLEFVNHIGAKAFQQGEEFRNELQKAEVDRECGVKDVPLWLIYKLPLPENEAMRALAEMVAYWENLAHAVMACKDYAIDVCEMKSFLEHALLSKSVTFYNETLLEHANRTDLASRCYTSKIAAAAAGRTVSPAGCVWLTQQAAREGVGWTLLANAYLNDVQQWLGVPGVRGARVHSYPLVFGNGEIGGMQQQTIQLTTKPCSTRLLLETMLGVVTETDKTRLETFEEERADGAGGVRVIFYEAEVGPHYYELYEELIAPQELQIRLLTAALLGRNSLSRAMADALDRDLRHASVLRDGASIESEAGYTRYNDTRPPTDGSKVGWKDAPIVPDHLAAARLNEMLAI